MRNRYLVAVAVLLFALSFAAGCASRQLTKATTDRLDAIAAKIAEAERMGAKECAPRELARAKVALDHARHEALEHFERAEEDIREAETAADDLLAKTKACVEARKPKEPAPAPPPVEPAPPPAEPAPPPAEPAPPPPIPVTEAIKIENIYFDFDKAFIREDAKPILKNVAAVMKKDKAAKMLIEGHCDERGTSEYNMALGDRRANSAKKYLVGLGVDRNRLMTISYGKEKPIDPGHDEQAWAKNRRAAFALK
jgi:peptidoglycan-associated lipoprotein